MVGEIKLLYQAGFGYITDLTFWKEKYFHAANNLYAYNFVNPNSQYSGENYSTKYKPSLTQKKLCCP